MKVDQDARREVDEWQREQTVLEAKADAEADEMTRVAEETLERDFQREKEEMLDQISDRTLREGWTADQWRNALLNTGMFGEEELDFAYIGRQIDDMLIEDLSQGDLPGDLLDPECYRPLMRRVHGVDSL